MSERTESAKLLRTVLVALALGVLAGCADEEDVPDAACTPGQQVACVCTDGSDGAQVCNTAGTSYAPCVCTGPEDTAEADSANDAGDDDAIAPDGSTPDTTADADADADDAASDTAVDVADTALDSDAAGTDVADDTADAEPSDVAEDTTPPAPIYVARVPDVALPWQNMGTIGYEAGVQLCQTAAGSAGHSDPSSVGVCEYQQVLAADAAGEFSGFVAGEQAWLHRTTAAMVGGVESVPGVGGRCNDWVCNACDHLADGEIVIFGDGAIAEYQLDNDTIFDPSTPGVHTQPGITPCNGQRYILCCNPATE